MVTGTGQDPDWKVLGRLPLGNDLDLSPGERGRVNQAGRGSGGRLDRRNSPDEGCRGRRGTERRSMESRGQGHRGRIDEDEKVGDWVGTD